MSSAETPNPSPEAPLWETPVFACRRCGACCHGQGGIILRRTDIARLAGHLGLTESEFLARYTRVRQGKRDLVCKEDGACVFFSAPSSCGVHEARPDICKAWPFFRGNLMDAESHALAAAYCPGISKERAFQEFSAWGGAYLERAGLVCRADEKNAPLALVLDRALPERRYETPPGGCGRP